MRNERIGDYLVNQGLISNEQLMEVLAAQKESNGTKKFGDVVVELGFMTELNFAKALAGNLRVQYVDLDNIEINTEAVQLVPEALARKHTVIAINVQGKRLTVATNDPVNFIVLEDIKVSTGMDTIPVLATTSAINKAIGRYYSMQNVDSVIDSVNAMGGDLGDMSQEESDSKDRVESAPIVKLATTIIENAYRADATDIHIEPFKTYTRIRIRVNGDLVELMNISSAVHSALTTRLKLISGMNIAEKRIPQDGRFTQVVDGTTLDVRVSSLPTVHGEKIVIRILSTGQIALRKITDLGMSDYNYQLFEHMLRVPHGVILVTGPTGSGKTTTLYAALGELAKPNVNVITVEDPVEKAIDGINQCQVNTKAGMTFAAALRSILRQDPDIVMVGEMRDAETADIGIRAAITGHLVLSTLHTNDAASTVVRLVDMGVASYMVATSLIGVIAQRLIKVLCPECKTPRLSTEEENELMGIPHSIQIYEPCGCQACNNTGYRGRTAIHEIIHCNSKVSTIIAAGGTKEEIETAAKENGTKLLRDNASELVQAGQTSIDELIRATFSV
ncbi:MAG: Flp pilus assembly complex ATPase component TadA [Ruminococcus flavefaciens]|nr:Flp pilus assembly complex ATPase component TadA [Ruminococcus flavefaciens]MCM1361446.1 Flp pilus assembly complex ATPase component TadA [Clostridiales bacterium]MCM1435915.1 Flp pilus assembly complex ATPase component TadA [Ruminococcus flavefaciens]